METSKAEVGSSNNISLGSKIIALAIATLCLCPPDNSCGNLEKEEWYSNGIVKIKKLNIE